MVPLRCDTWPASMQPTLPPNAVVLIRHGQTRDNAAGLILGRRDPPLSDAGRAEADRLAGELRGNPIAAVWTSPLRRARETASIVAAALGLEPIVCAELVESDRGRWEGRAVARIERDEPELHAAFVRGDPDFAFPEGESLREQRARTRAALARVSAGTLPAVVVAHAGTVRAALALSDRPVGPESALPHGAVAACLSAGDLGVRTNSS